VAPKNETLIARLKERSAARRQREIPCEVLLALSHGWIESKNLVEWLSVDRLILLKELSNELDVELTLPLRKLIKDRQSLSPLQLSKQVAKELSTILQPGDSRLKTKENTAHKGKWA